MESAELEEAAATPQGLRMGPASFSGDPRRRRRGTTTAGVKPAALSAARRATPAPTTPPTAQGGASEADKRRDTRRNRHQGARGSAAAHPRAPGAEGLTSAESMT